MKATFQSLRNKVLTFQWSPKYERKHRQANKDGSVMGACKKNIASMRKEDTIKHAADKMLSNRTRRVFVIGSGGALEGVVTCKDIVNFLGGGEKHRIVQKKHGGDLISGMNEPVREIMTQKLVSIDSSKSFDDAFKLIKKTGVGGIPILEDGKLVGSVTEKKIVNLISKSLSGQMVKNYMSKNVIFGSSGEQVSDVAKAMIRNSFRRLPILKERELAGIITAKDIVHAFAKNFSPSFVETRVSKLMKKPITVSSTATLSDAAKIMSQNNISGMPVMSGDKVVGVITAKDLIKAVEL
ncbi:MAG: CBS domain-containing protein [archaeon]